MALNTVRLKYTIGSSLVEAQLSGSGGSIAEARAELAAKAKVVVGTAIRQTETVEVAATAPGGAGDFNDMVLILGKAGQPDRSLTIANASLTYATDSKGRVDVTDADLIAIATAYRDGDNLGGYSLKGGYVGTN